MHLKPTVRVLVGIMHGSWISLTGAYFGYRRMRDHSLRKLRFGVYGTHLHMYDSDDMRSDWIGLAT
jgi:hypothetical protein